MKKLLTIIIILVFNSSLFSQTETEAKEWIIETYKSFKRAENQNDFLLIEKDSIIFHSYFYNYSFNKVAIKDIKSIQIRKRKREGIEWYQIDLKTNEKIVVGKYESKTYTRDYSNGKIMTILLSPEFGVDDYPKRMEKALIHLVSLYGGKAIAIKETF